MPAMNQPRHAPSLYRPLLLLVLAGGLGGACGDESPEPGLLLFDRGAYDFGQLHAGQASAERTLTVRNGGTDTLHDLGVRLEPGDSFEVVATSCAGSLAPSRTCTITVEFSPARAGEALADLVVEADRAGASAALTGLGAVTVRVVNNALGGVVIESEPAGIRCGSMCEATFTASEIVLQADTRTAVWSAPCEATAENDCVLAALSADTVIITLQDAVVPRWRLDGGQYTSVVIDARNDVIATRRDAPSLLKLSPAGAIVWQNDDLDGGLAAAVDAQGNIGFAGLDGLVRKLDAAGNEQWSLDRRQIGLDVIVDVAFDPSGALFVAGTQGTTAEDVVLLVKLDSDGEVLWSRTQAPGFNHYVADLVVDVFGSAIYTGGGTAGPEASSAAVRFVHKSDGDGNFTFVIPAADGALATDAAGYLYVDEEPWLHKYDSDGSPMSDTYLGDDISGISSLAVTPARDVIAAGTRYQDGAPVGMWITKLDGVVGTRRRTVELQGEVPFHGHIAVDGNGDVVIAGGDGDFGLRKYDGAYFDLLDE